VFDRYKTYKQEAKVMTTPESIKKRFEIILNEFTRLHPWITKDKERLYDIEQKRVLYFRQKGKCAKCGKEMSFAHSSGHHVIAHSDGGHTDDLSKAVLLHEKCHQIIEKQKLKGIQFPFPEMAVQA
ncbi:MAG TPA: HNH endonuclease signature motif containing protein, partial [Dehalococcoidales bacterium]|nr:HNH endonuclease signature motif containing protein [Dehalococcoidales bacterium]